MFPKQMNKILQVNLLCTSSGTVINLRIFTLSVITVPAHVRHIIAEFSIVHN